MINAVGPARIDVWQGEEPPLIICESRATMGVLRDLTYQYLVPITATNGQSGGFIVNDIVPLLKNQRRVLYIGDYELRGPADQIEANTKRYIEEHTGAHFRPRRVDQDRAHRKAGEASDAEAAHDHQARQPQQAGEGLRGD